MAKPLLSVVIPTLDEATTLPALLEDIAGQSLTPEVIVADGGSTDGTTEIAARYGALIVAVGRGRARQMNAGAAAAHGRALLFLHADSRLGSASLLDDAMQTFEHHLREGGPGLAGHFRLKFDRSRADQETLYRYMEAKTGSGRPGTINGDQGLMLTPEFFERLGRFDPSLPFLEDQRIAQKIFAHGRWILLPGSLRTSARRFEAQGQRRRYALMGLMMVMQEAGLDTYFEQARDLYAEQSQAQELDLAPYLDLAFRLLGAAMWRDPALARYLGRYTRSNAWQLGLAVDVGMGSSTPSSWTRRFDTLGSAQMDHPVSDWVAAGVGAGILAGVRLLSGWVELQRR